jgi:hypothetical protein
VQKKTGYIIYTEASGKIVDFDMCERKSHISRTSSVNGHLAYLYPVSCGAVHATRLALRRRRGDDHERCGTLAASPYRWWTEPRRLPLYRLDLTCQRLANLAPMVGPSQPRQLMPDGTER